MQKYWHVINVGLQNNLTYRFNFFARAVFGLIPLIATLYVWQTIYSGKGQGSEVGSYTLAEMVSYYLLVTVVDALTAVNEDDWQIAADIKDGNISQFLLKPIDYLAYRLCLFFSGRISYLAVAAVPLFIFIFCLRHYFIFPADWPTFGLFLFSVVLTALLQFFTSYAMAMLAFWVLKFRPLSSSFLLLSTSPAGIYSHWISCRTASRRSSFSRRSLINCIFRSAFIWARSRALPWYKAYPSNSGGLSLPTFSPDSCGNEE